MVAVLHKVPERWLTPFRQLIALWNRLSEPLVNIEEPEDRNKSRLMASLSLALGLVLVPVIIFWTTSSPSSESEVLASVVVLFSLILVQYISGRLGHYKFGCALSVVIGTAVVVYFASRDSDPSSRLNLIDYLAVILLYTSLFLSMPMLVVFFAAEVGVIFSFTCLL